MCKLKIQLFLRGRSRLAFWLFGLLVNYAHSANLPMITDTTPMIQPGATAPGTAKIIPLDIKVVYQLDFANWEDDHLHWQAPSSISCYTNGTCIVKAAHLANMKRVGDLQDVGYKRTFVVNLELVDQTGRVVWANHIIVDSLSYKYERENVVKNQKFENAEIFFNKGYQMRIDREILSEGASPVASMPYSP